MASEDTEPIVDDGEAEQTTQYSCAVCDPRTSWHRYFALFFMCFLSFGSYFCYDNPAALQDHLRQDLGLSSTQFMSFYSWYSWPNVVLSLFGGFLMDRVFGIRLGAVIFASFVFAGQLVFATGAYLNKFWLMDAGRFVFGMGGENLQVAQNAYAVGWFKGKELNMVFGLQLSMARIGSTVNMNIMGPVYDLIKKSFDGPSYQLMGIVLFTSALSCTVSLFCASYMGYLDKRKQKLLDTDVIETGEVVSLWDVKDFPLSLWLICAICVFYYAAVFPFIGIGLVFFEQKFGLSPSSANAVNGLVYIISAVASPIMGFLVDRTGKNLFWVMLGVVSTILCHGMLAFSFINPYVSMSIMGVTYSILASSLWPMVSIVIPDHQLGTAYGLMQSIQNLGLAVISLAAGVIVDAKGYLVLEIFFIACLCLALISCTILFLLDLVRKTGLNLSAKERQRIADEKEKKAEALSASGQTIPSVAVFRSRADLLRSSEFQIRNRYLSKIGAHLPPHYNVQNRALSLQIRRTMFTG